MANPYNKTGAKRQLHPSVQFWVEIDGDATAAFTECSGLNFEVKTEPIEEGGVNDFVHEVPKGVNYGRLTLKAGVGDSRKLWSWFQSSLSGSPQRKNITITLYDSMMVPVQSWSFKEAYPVKWQGPDLKADQAAIALQQLEIVHKGLV